MENLRPDDPVLQYAAAELARCLFAMTGKDADLRLGLFADFPELQPVAVGDARWDDAYVIQSTGEGLVIAGINARSVLLGGYRYLRELGARWLWPGANGEYLPQLGAARVAGFAIRYAPPFRHRAICIEGAVSIEHELDYVEWMPRVGLNSYMLQFQNSGHFWRLWYSHELNDLWPEERSLSDAEAAALDDQVIAGLQQRGMLLHRVGHGWSAVALGFDVASGWPQWDGKSFPEEFRHLMAEVKGKRDLWDNSPVNTELCYSQPEARERFIAGVLDYAERHPEVDALHLWLSDANNNTCECAECTKLAPADWYLLMLNELTPRLRAINPNMHVVFLCYFNTMWPPLQVKLDPENDNLIFRYAPITRCYRHAIGDASCGEPLGERPPVNQVEVPRENRALVELLEQWAPFMPADSFVFDYHFWMPWRLDHIAFNLAEVMPDDVRDYAALGLKGMMACSGQRVFWPTGWPLQQMALLLAGEDAGLEEEQRYYQLAYGASWAVAEGFLDGMDERRARPAHRQDWWEGTTAEQAAATLDWLEAQEEVLQHAEASSANRRERIAWGLLRHFQEYAVLMWRLAEAWQRGDHDGAVRLVGEAEEFIKRTEPDVHRFSDGYFHLIRLGAMRRNLTTPPEQHSFFG